MNTLESIQKRYSTKKFDTTKKIPETLWNEVEQSLRLAASSVNAQPWHFIVAFTDEGKQRLLKGTSEKFAFNDDRINTASHVVLFCTRTKLEDNYLAHITEVEDKDGRYPTEETKNAMDGGRRFFHGIHANELKDEKEWNEKQVYLNVGSSLVTAALLQIDACPMEGIDVEALNKEFDLESKGLTASVMVAYGYRSTEDYNAKTPKSRLPIDEIITRI